ncbi:inactive receptor-like serine/threonine-protein kinase At2g40270 [Phragmites australis]|uniref:inactive receptor-like serine/threonine-protein kinase At2g40270 n=1 Tax=Phragmites australis TaxID=29695 RepID=UPI002D794A61|nr:inactive receptor-like serine/threonine-protein kinase At2g40270 [Phragmites australis]XP_062231142.1 inactive receptor-like serine/threonine-protein kinase At2g40270 [Phragmites australis]
MFRAFSFVSMEKLRCAVVALLLLSLLPDLGSCYDAEQETMIREEDMRSGSEARVIQGEHSRKFLLEQNKYWSGHFGSKAGWPDFTPPAYTGGGSFQGSSFPPPSTFTPNQQPPYPQWPPWPWTPKLTPTPSFPPLHAPASSPVAKKPMPLPGHAKNPAHSIALPPQPAAVPADVGSNPVVAGVAPETKHSGVTRHIYVIAAAGASLLAAVSVALFVLCYRSNKVVTVRPWATGLSGQLQKAFVTGVPSLKRSELELACEDFSNVIGSLSDYMVYKGTLSSGVEIAVVSTMKISAKEWSKHCETQFRKKITSLSRVNHKNFVNLLGYCQEEQPFTRMMVFEYAPNGTLFEHLHVREDGHLDWPTRLRVAVGVAYCLEHMHQLSPPEILRTLDTSTICLTEDFAAKISDVFFCDEPREEQAGIASLSPVLLDKESVVYSYGMVLLEIMTGRFTASEGGLLESWAASYLRGERQLRDVMDPSLRRPFHAATVDRMDGVIRGCTDREPRRRLTMPEVARRLREITAMPPDAATPKVSPLWWAELEIISTEVN